MKRAVFFAVAAALAAALWQPPFRGADMGTLKPVEVLRVSKDRGRVRVETDTGDFGEGKSLSASLKNLKETTAGEVFLETADYLILSPEAVALLSELAEHLRPGCGVCVEAGKADPGSTGAFFAAHPPKVTLKDCRAGEEKLPLLIAREEEMRLVQ